jgi:NAD(P)-dependent dehydrogenase (short-subunit alcohol dehydrogenase family)
MIMLMRCIVAPMAKYNIRVNCICPGPVATDKWLEEQKVQAKLSGMDFDTYYKAAVERIPLKRTITEAEIASAAAFLVSDKASGMTGVAFPVDGGFAAV